MVDKGDIFTKELKNALFYKEEIGETVESSNRDDVFLEYQRAIKLIDALEEKLREATDELIDQDKLLTEVRQYNKKSKEELKPLRHVLDELKSRLEELEGRERALKEEKLMRKKSEIELDLVKARLEKEGEKPHAVKLQRYTITLFTGNFTDWLRFWNQFQAEVDASKISEISKFNYLLELVKGKPKESILGLPHTEEGYKEAKAILVQTYGKDIKVHKALKRELESLPNINSIKQLKEIHDFQTKLSRTVRTLNTMKKLEGAQSYVYSIMDKLGPVRESMAQKDNKWEEWGLEELVDNLRKYTDRNPLPNEMGGQCSNFTFSFAGPWDHWAKHLVVLMQMTLVLIFYFTHKKCTTM